MAKKWCIGQPRFYKNIRKDINSEDLFVSEEDYLRALPKYSILTIPENQRKITDKEGANWAEVLYKNIEGEDILGWVKDSFLEDLVSNLNFAKSEVNIQNPTKNPADAAQYMIWDGHAKYNMCGELCIAFIVGDDIETLLTKWKEKGTLGYYINLVAKTKDKPLYEPHLRAILKVYGYRNLPLNLAHEDGAIIKYKEGLKSARHFFISPGRLKKMLETHYLIARVRQSSRGTFLPKDAPRNSWVGHWVVLDKIEPYGVERGKVEVYNPYSNKREEHSYIEFKKSCANGYSGYWVSRTPPA